MKRKVGLAMAIVLAIAIYTRRSCPIEQGWMGPVPHYDYLRNITFEQGGRGEMVYGSGQHMVCEVAFQWERHGGAIDIDARTIGVQIDSGKFKAPVNDYPKPTERRFGCRITFDADPFPGGCGEGRVFYACPLD